MRKKRRLRDDFLRFSMDETEFLNKLNPVGETEAEIKGAHHEYFYCFLASHDHLSSANIYLFPATSLW